ncbi:hypothetical protein VUR80DRAFT_8027 [Thermomyces stellatus]
MATKRSSFPPDSSSSKDDVKGGPSRAATQQTSGPLRADRAGPDDAQHWATFVPPPLFEAPALPDPLSGIVEEMLEDLETRYGRIGRRSNQTARLVAAETALRVAHALAPDSLLAAVPEPSPLLTSPLQENAHLPEDGARVKVEPDDVDLDNLYEATPPQPRHPFPAPASPALSPAPSPYDLPSRSPPRLSVAECIRLRDQQRRARINASSQATSSSLKPRRSARLAARAGR